MGKLKKLIATFFEVLHDSFKFIFPDRNRKPDSIRGWYLSRQIFPNLAVPRNDKIANFAVIEFCSKKLNFAVKKGDFVVKSFLWHSLRNQMLKICRCSAQFHHSFIYSWCSVQFHHIKKMIIYFCNFTLKMVFCTKFSHNFKIFAVFLGQWPISRYYACIA